MVRWSPIFALWTCAALLAGVDGQRTPEEDRLRRFYVVTDGDRWINNTNWNTDVPICSWYGVMCDAGPDNDEGVTAINMESNNLVGKVSRLIYEMPQLRVLNLKNNKLRETGFEAFKRAEAADVIEYINLADNALTFVTGIGDAPASLKELHLTENRIRNFPIQVTNLVRLKKLFLSFNFIEGTLPSQIGKMVGLQQLFLYGNDMEGQIPSEIGYLNKLEVITLAENSFTGTLPLEVNNMHNLRTFSVHNNIDGKGKIGGPMPSFSTAPYLDEIYLDGNAFTGTIPQLLLINSNRTKNQVTIGLSNNRLEGALPPGLSRFRSLTIDVTGNRITSMPRVFCEKGAWMSGAVETFGCDAILCDLGFYNTDGRQTSDNNTCTECKAATYLGARECNATQELESWKVLAMLYSNTRGVNWTTREGWSGLDLLLNNANIDDIDGSQLQPCSWSGVTCDNDVIASIILSNNNLVGVIPSELFQLTGLATLDLSRNPVSVDDTIGLAALGQAASLTSLSLSATKITTLDGIDFAHTLTKLYLDGIELGGQPMPTEMFTLTQLMELHMQFSYFTGTLPTQIGMLSKLTRLNLYNNELGGDLPSELGLLTDIVALELSENEFGGVLPDELTALSNLQRFRIHQVKGTLGGPLPSFSQFPVLHELSMDSNQFTGSIPDDFLSGIVNKTRPVRVELAFNNLTGLIPESLKVLDSVLITLEGNQITGIPAPLCQKPNWMNGEVGVLGNICDAILCPPLTTNLFGRASSKFNGVCTPCDTGIYWGQTWCGADSNPNPEKTILDKIYKLTGGHYWKHNTNWTTAGVPICHRQGVSCDGNTDGDSGVTELRFNNFGLNGLIPPDVFELTHLRLLGLSDNEIDISFEEIDKAVRLETLQLSNVKITNVKGLDKAPDGLLEIHLADNHLTGTFPAEFLALSNVRSLFLHNNLFTGSIPSEIQQMAGLQYLWLSANEITGQIPGSIGNMTKMIKLDLSMNFLTGNLPTEFEMLPDLDFLMLAKQKSDKKLSGPLLSFASNSKLVFINLENNDFVGSIPANILASVPADQKVTLGLASNALTGIVPTELGRFSSLYIEVIDNEITGLSGALCNNAPDSLWMNGLVGQFGCNAILCPPGHSLPRGRQTLVDATCEPCPNGIQDAPFFGATSCVGAGIDVERGILMELYRRLNGTEWIDQTNWMSEKSVCAWYGVLCDENGVVELKLEENNLDATGEVSQLFFALPHLVRLDIKGNSVPLDLRVIPQNSQIQVLKLSATDLESLEGISKATDLRRVHVTDNGLTGKIPDELFTLTELRSLFMSFNSFTGTLPVDLVKLSNLEELYIYGNMLTGSIPGAAIPALTNLRDFIMPDNLFSGELPTEFGALANLEQLSLYNQQGLELITGKLPDFAGARKLWYLDLSNNDITGSIPASFMENSIYKDEAVTVYLSNNEITGVLPEVLDGFRDLDIEIVGNLITGIPAKLCDDDNALWMRGQLKAVGNCNAIACPPTTYSESGRQESPDSPCQPCTFLQDSNVWGNNFCADTSVEVNVLLQIFQATGGENWSVQTGWSSNQPICSWHGVVCGDGDRSDTSGVTTLDLEDNNMVGTLPAAIWSLPFLRAVNFKDNFDLHINFEGFTDTADGLELLYLSGTRIDSLAGVSRASSLRNLHITDCGLTGHFPEEVYDMRDTLEGLFIAYNSFSGTISTRIGDMFNLTYFYAFDNDFTGTIPTEMGLLGNLEYLVLSENLLSGQIPDELSNLERIKLLSIYRRNKPGPKPTGSLPSFSRSPELADLYLDHNELTGSIPENFLSASLGVSLVTLSHNRLTGTVPASISAIRALTIELQGNEISGFSEIFCNKQSWMGGDISDVGCDGFLCPPKTSNILGRANMTSSCEACDSAKAAPFYGSVSCEERFTERRVLVRLYQQCGGTKWYEQEKWLSVEPICQWHGITCNSKEQVQSIDLGSNNLVGTPPSDLFTLPELDTLWLHSNPVSVSFEGIDAATKLTDLRLDSTGLKTVSGIDEARFLTKLNLQFNSLEGPLPGEILFLTNLRSLNIANNKLGGVLPGFDELQYLNTLRLGSNRFTGALPTFETMLLLRTLDLSDNMIEGFIRTRFLNFVPNSATLDVDLSSNLLTGTLPSSLDRFQDVTIYLRENRIRSLPQVFCDNNNWNGGDVETFGCDGIMCPPGTHNLLGRERQGQPCIACEVGSPYYGQVVCPVVSSATSTTFGIAAVFSTAAVLLGMVM